MSNKLKLPAKIKSLKKNAERAKKFRSGGFKWSMPPVLIRAQKPLLRFIDDGMYPDYMEFKDVPVLGMFRIPDRHPATAGFTKEVLGASHEGAREGTFVLMRTSDKHAHIIRHFAESVSQSPMLMIRIKFKRGHLVSPLGSIINYVNLED